MKVAKLKFSVVIHIVVVGISPGHELSVVVEHNVALNPTRIMVLLGAAGVSAFDCGTAQ